MSRELAVVSQETAEPLDVVQIEERLATACATLKTCTWEITDLLYVSFEQQSWRDSVDLERRQNFTSFSRWVEQRTPLTRGTASKLVAVKQRVLKLPPALQARAYQAEPLRLYPVRDVLGRDPEQALALASSKRSDSKLYDSGAELAPEQHRDGSRVRVRWWVSQPVAALLEQARNVARYHAHLRDPDDNVVATALCRAIIPELPTDLTDAEVTDILAGNVKCTLFGTPDAVEDCTGWDVTQLDPHHVRARSHGGHDGPVITLCRRCHNYHQPRWRELAARLGYDEIAEGV